MRVESRQDRVLHLERQLSDAEARVRALEAMLNESDLLGKMYECKICMNAKSISEIQMYFKSMCGVLSLHLGYHNFLASPFLIITL